MWPTEGFPATEGRGKASCIEELEDGESPIRKEKVVVKNPPANAGDMGSSPGPGRSHMPRSN